MLLQTIVRDCLYVNWALPRGCLPGLPEGLRYELHSAGDECHGFVSALLFRQSGLRFAALPWVRLSYSQLNVRLYVLDEEGVPSVLFRALIVPPWVLPLAEAAGQSGLTAGRFVYPRPSRDLEANVWTWRATARGCLQISARQGAPNLGAGPDLGSWQRTCDYFRRRDRGYMVAGGKLRQIETSHSPTAVWPMKVDVLDDGLPRDILGSAPDDRWPEVHSAWLCPEIPLNFELGGVEKRVLASRVPAPG